MGCSNALTTESEFVGDGREHIVVKFQPVYWLDRARVGVRSSGGSIYWRKNLSIMSDFVEDQNGEAWESARLVQCGTRTLSFERCWGANYLAGIRRSKCQGRTRRRNEEENVSIIPVLKPRASRSKSSKQDLKGKGVAFSPEKSNKIPCQKLMKPLEERGVPC